MLLSPEFVRLCLCLCLLGMAVLAAFSLRGRTLSAPAFMGWGLLIVLVPLIGPFLVILFGYRPGSRPRLRS
jgi:hypothetical protein